MIFLDSWQSFVNKWDQASDSEGEQDDDQDNLEHEDFEHQDDHHDLEYEHLGLLLSSFGR